MAEEGNPACLSSCSGGLRPLVELCVEPAGLCGPVQMTQHSEMGWWSNERPKEKDPWVI